MTFDEALAPHYEDALRYCRALCVRGGAAVAEDVAHDAFLSAMEHFGELRDHERFRPWLFQIITRAHAQALRRAFWRRFLPIPDDPDSGSFGDVLAEVPLSDERLLLDQALARLSERERAAVLLFEVGGFSLVEIAEIQGDTSLSAVKSRLSRARSRLAAAVRALQSTPSPAPDPRPHETSAAR